MLVRDLAPGSHDSRLHNLTAAGGTLYFGATDEIHGYELWRSDGTAAGTTLVQDIQPGPTPSNPDQLTAADGVLYFTANDGEHGREALGAAAAPVKNLETARRRLQTAVCLHRR